MVHSSYLRPHAAQPSVKPFDSLCPQSIYRCIGLAVAGYDNVLVSGHISPAKMRIILEFSKRLIALVYMLLLFIALVSTPALAASPCSSCIFARPTPALAAWPPACCIQSLRSLKCWLCLRALVVVGAPRTLGVEQSIWRDWLGWVAFHKIQVDSSVLPACPFAPKHEIASRLPQNPQTPRAALPSTSAIGPEPSKPIQKRLLAASEGPSASVSAVSGSDTELAEVHIGSTSQTMPSASGLRIDRSKVYIRPAPQTGPAASGAEPKGNGLPRATLAQPSRSSQSSEPRRSKQASRSTAQPLQSAPSSGLRMHLRSSGSEVFTAAEASSPAGVVDGASQSAHVAHAQDQADQDMQADIGRNASNRNSPGDLHDETPNGALQRPSTPARSNVGRNVQGQQDIASPALHAARHNGHDRAVVDEVITEKPKKRRGRPPKSAALPIH